MATFDIMTVSLASSSDPFPSDPGLGSGPPAASMSKRRYFPPRSPPTSPRKRPRRLFRARMAGEFVGFFELRSIVNLPVPIAGEPVRTTELRDASAVKQAFEALVAAGVVPSDRTRDPTLVRSQARGGRALSVKIAQEAVVALHGPRAEVPDWCVQDIWQGYHPSVTKANPLPRWVPHGRKDRRVVPTKGEARGFFRVASLAPASGSEFARSDLDWIRGVAQNMTLDYGSEILRGRESGKPLEMDVTHLPELLERMRRVGLGNVTVCEERVSDLTAESGAGATYPSGESASASTGTSTTNTAPSVGEEPVSDPPVTEPVTESENRQNGVRTEPAPTLPIERIVRDPLGHVLGTLAGQIEIRIDRSSGMFDLTQMCRSAKQKTKKFKLFKKLREIHGGRDFKTVCADISANEGLPPARVFLEGAGVNGGSMGCRTLAVKVARWCVPNFADAADALIGRMAEHYAEQAGAAPSGSECDDSSNAIDRRSIRNRSQPIEGLEDIPVPFHLLASTGIYMGVWGEALVDGTWHAHLKVGRADQQPVNSRIKDHKGERPKHFVLLFIAGCAPGACKYAEGTLKELARDLFKLRPIALEEFLLETRRLMEVTGEIARRVVDRHRDILVTVDDVPRPHELELEKYRIDKETNVKLAEYCSNMIMQAKDDASREAAKEAFKLALQNMKQGDAQSS